MNSSFLLFMAEGSYISYYFLIVEQTTSFPDLEEKYKTIVIVQVWRALPQQIASRSPEGQSVTFR